MIGTLEAGLHPCSQPISMPLTPGSDAHRRMLATLGAGRRCGQVTTAKQGTAWASAQGEREMLSSPPKFGWGRRLGLAQQGDDDIWS